MNNPYAPPKAPGTVGSAADTTAILRKVLTTASVLQALGLLHDGSRLYEMWRVGDLNVLSVGLLPLASLCLLVGGVLLPRNSRRARGFFIAATILSVLIVLGENTHTQEMLRYAFSLYRMLWLVPSLALVSWVMSYKILPAKSSGDPSTTDDI